ncbi:MAG: Uncharacterised protein [Marine Group II euryarchaeote MED-G33]|nr:MAG: Uncharacterised protein [Marine Group II euryarchaeote MED-G33]
MREFRCEGCGASIDISGLEPTVGERKIFCVRCGHTMTI